jgi:hypothetical protein
MFLTGQVFSIALLRRTIVYEYRPRLILPGLLGRPFSGPENHFHSTSEICIKKAKSFQCCDFDANILRRQCRLSDPRQTIGFSSALAPFPSFRRAPSGTPGRRSPLRRSAEYRR